MTVQDAPGARVPGHRPQQLSETISNCDVSPPKKVGAPLKVRVPVPVLVSVIAWAALRVLISWSPKPSAPTLSEAKGAVVGTADRRAGQADDRARTGDVRGEGQSAAIRRRSGSARSAR
ncbi:MAG: hypothetical protein U0841_09760 [Chloroflexia bacterium]